MWYFILCRNANEQLALTIQNLGKNLESFVLYVYLAFTSQMPKDKLSGEPTSTMPDREYKVNMIKAI